MKIFPDKFYIAYPNGDTYMCFRLNPLLLRSRSSSRPEGMPYNIIYVTCKSSDYLTSKEFLERIEKSKRTAYECGDPGEWFTQYSIPKKSSKYVCVTEDFIEVLHFLKRE